MRFILIFLISISSFANVSELSSISTVLKLVESGGDPLAIGDSGKAYGILQIHKITVDDINRIYGTTYTHQDAFDEVCSEEMFFYYINAGIKRYVNRYNRQPTEEEIVRFWNGGIYKGHRIDATVKYYKRYLYFKKKILQTW